MSSLIVPPRVIQGGMGFHISHWPLARTISLAGQQGTISGVALDQIMARILRSGDPGGHLRRALHHFPFPQISDIVMDYYFAEEGTSGRRGRRGVPVFQVNPSRLLIALTICANFSYVWLAKEGHTRPVSINYLEKLALPHLYALTGAMLAHVDIVTMGAGIALQIPAAMRDIAEGRVASYRIPVIGSTVKSVMLQFDPRAYFQSDLPPMRIPKFLPIIASHELAHLYYRKLPTGSVDGFVVEEPTAGGHNAPPRTTHVNVSGESIKEYGERDIVEYGRIADLGLPFWIGGSKASPKHLAWAQSQGAVGIQTGSIFALSEDSGMDPTLRRQIRARAFHNSLHVRTDMRISPTGFPFKVADLPGTISDPATYTERRRVCNLSALVSPYEKSDGSIGYRCASEPEDIYVAKGGNRADTVGRGCLCNGLLSATGLGDPNEPPLITMGDDTSFLVHLMQSEDDSYTALDALAYLLGLSPTRA